jgi:outer membrane protein OmpA-like peptidoglycan-associated protein
VAKQIVEDGGRSNNHRKGATDMRMLMFGIAGLALAAPAVLAQQPPGPAPTSAVSQQTEPGRYWVFFDFNRSDLRPDAREVLAEAADSFKRTGSTHISLVGSADRTGSPAYNEELSRRRADAVRTELERLGVPASVITVNAEGENAPIVPTPQGVREARNRYVAIDFPERAAVPPVPPPVAAAPAVPPPALPPKWAVSLGPWYGHNLKETNSGSQEKSSDLVGPELRADYALTPNWSLYGDLVGFNTIGTSSDDGWGGRAALGVSHQWNLGAWHPFIGPKIGYVGGKGVQDGGLVGPELGVRFDVARDVFLYAQAAYDHTFRNDFDEGIINGGIGAGYRF